ncbi:MAG: DUF1127 domain-containing protein, partial [Xanthobacteraceae bacterium]
MSVITSTVKPAEGSFPRTIFALAAAVSLRLKRFVRAYANRSDATVLAGFDERMLADIGLTRSDVRDAFAEPLWEDPTNLLRARVLERRLNQYRIGFGFKEADVSSPPLAP